MAPEGPSATSHPREEYAVLRVLAFVLLSIVAQTGCQRSAPSGGNSEPHESGRPALPERTAGVDRPWPTDPSKFTFAIIGDRTIPGADSWTIFDRAVDEVNRLRPDFVLMVGDMIMGYTTNVESLGAQWAEAGEHMARADIPLIALPGNHDVTNETMLAYWKQHIGATYFSFDYKGCHFLLLNTDEVRHEGRSSFGEEQIAFAVSDIAATSGARHTFVLMHRPAWQDANTEDEWTNIQAALGGRDYTVFAGHRHGLSLQIRSDRRYFVLSATGGGLEPNDDKSAGAFHHYTAVTVEDADAHVAIVEPGNVWPEDVSGQ